MRPPRIADLLNIFNGWPNLMSKINEAKYNRESDDPGNSND